MTKDYHPNDERMPMGCLPRTTTCGDFLPVMGEVETAPLVDRSKLKDMDLSAQNGPVISQSPQNSCTACALTGAMLHLRQVAGGAKTPFAWSTLYGPCNGGHDGGSPIDMVLNHLMRVGIAPQIHQGEKFVDPYDWRGYYQGSWPVLLPEVSRQFRCIEAWDAPSFDHVLAGMHHGYVGIIGVRWPGGGGHCVMTTGYDKNRRRVRLLNTWSRSWGENGYGWLDERVCSAGVPVYGGFIMRAASVADVDPLPPPIKK